MGKCDTIQANLLDLTGIPLPTRDVSLYQMMAASLGRSQVCQDSGSHRPEGGHLNASTAHFTQRAEIIALTQALRWAEGGKGDIYTDS